MCAGYRTERTNERTNEYSRTLAHAHLSNLTVLVPVFVQCSTRPDTAAPGIWTVSAGQTLGRKLNGTKNSATINFLCGVNFLKLIEITTLEAEVHSFVCIHSLAYVVDICEGISENYRLVLAVSFSKTVWVQTIHGCVFPFF